MDKFKSLLNQYEDYITFYHECRIPKHPFFDLKKNKKLERLLVISSPSRMGNHLLMSGLDAHPELPSVPGEDGFHMFSFTQANYDICDFMKRLRSSHAVAEIMDIASNGGGSKWEKLSKLSSDENVGYSGVGAHQHSAIVDFEGVHCEVGFDAYKQSLEREKKGFQSAKAYNDVLLGYVNALSELTPQNIKTQFDGYLVHGGMRTQLLWLCETMPNVKILSSVRSFESYAVSQIKSRYGDVELTDEKLQEAWEHWFHKVVDMLYLRLHYPDQFGLVTFDDLVGEPVETMKTISRFLNVEYSESMLSATIMGTPVKGNSWKSRSSKKAGGFYKPADLIQASQVPNEAREIWQIAKEVKLR